MHSLIKISYNWSSNRKQIVNAEINLRQSVPIAARLNIDYLRYLVSSGGTYIDYISSMFELQLIKGYWLSCAAVTGTQLFNYFVRLVPVTVIDFL